MVLEKVLLSIEALDELMQRGGRYRELCGRQFIRDRQSPESLYDLAAGSTIPATNDD